MAIYLVVIALAVALGSWLPLLYVGLPSLYGRWLTHYFAFTQHAGLADNVLDHRLNSRTVYMNPVMRFLYWNMNYHIEHHMFPMVPYHALPRLHEELRDDLPTPCAARSPPTGRSFRRCGGSCEIPNTTSTVICRRPRSRSGPTCTTW